VGGEWWNTQFLVNMPATNVPGGNRSKVKTLGLQHLQPPHVSEGGGPPCGGRTIHHVADELFVQQDSVPGGEITSPVQEQFSSWPDRRETTR